MTTDQLYASIKAKRSMLCVGLDTDFNNLPEHLKNLALGGETAIKG